MKRKHPARLTAAGIDEARYLELRALCRQYPRDKRRLHDVRAGIVDRTEGGCTAWKPPDPTGNQAARLADETRWLERRVALIEDCAENICREGRPALRWALIKRVSLNLTWEELSPPMGRNQFYDLALSFYIELNWREKTGL